MDVIVKFFGVYRDLSQEKERKVPCDLGTTVQTLYESVTKTFPKKFQKIPVLFAVNQEYAKPSHKLKNGDECAFIPPMSGG